MTLIMKADDRSHLKIPGKVFLLGEYIVMEGGPALLATVEPCFEWSSDARPEFEAFLPHPQSPAGRWLALHQHKPSGFFFDPHRGAGGLGRSTAEFLAAYVQYEQHSAQKPAREHAQSIWAAYRATQADQKSMPSGADIVTQTCGGVIEFQIQSDATLKIESLRSGAPIELYLATANDPTRKVETHTHLAQLAELAESGRRREFDHEVLGAIVSMGLSAYRSARWDRLGDAFTRYAQALFALGLETAATTEIRSELSKLPGVLGVKGTGALQADAILVVRDPDAPEGTRRSLEAAALKWNLKPLAQTQGFGGAS